MTGGTGAGKAAYELRQRIQQVQHELDELGPPSEIPELITSANLLRSNEYLSKSNEKRIELLEAYGQYSRVLEDLLSSVLEIQHDLKEIVTEQSHMIAGQSKPKKTRTTPKKTRTTPKKTRTTPKKTRAKPKTRR